MLNALPVTRPSGFSLVEMMVSITIMAILLAIAMPSFQSWLKNIQIRNAAESITNGLQRARAEAVAQNIKVTFVLGTDTSWTVDYEVLPGPNPSPIDSRLATEGSTNVTLTALAADLATPATTITYNGLGQVVANAGGSASLTQIDVTAVGGNALRVELNAGGGARMCDPSLAAGSSFTAC